MDWCLYLPLLLLLAPVLHAGAPADLEYRLEATFEALLELEDIVLEPEEREKRLGLFTVNCLAQTIVKDKKTVVRGREELCPHISLDSIYTLQELAGMNGAVLQKTNPPQVAPHRIQKRQVEEMVPTSYDVRDEIEVSTPSHQGECGNCYIHSFVSALEIAYTKQTRKLIPFSRQELTDCFYSGCDGGDYRVLANAMAVSDHLAATHQYGPYLSRHTKRKFACKAPLTPDSLLDIMVTGYKTVAVDDLDYYLYKHGSIMSCLEWTESGGTNCGKLQHVGSEVFDGDTVPFGCNHAVLIVGYTPQYYIVKNSHGVSWGDGGYFKIKRGTNACGIEDQMAVLITSPRENAKKLAPNKCPLDHPTYCDEALSCTSGNYCHPVQSHDTLIRRKLSKRSSSIQDIIARRLAERRQQQSLSSRETVRGRRPVITRTRYDQSSSARRLKSFQFLSAKQECKDRIGAARCEMYKARGYCVNHLFIKEVDCRKTCEMCWDNLQEDGCSDASESCAQLSLTLCNMMYRVRKNCPARCNTCHLVNPEQFHSAVTWIPKQPSGPCNIPNIPHGRVTGNHGNTLRPEEELRVTCDEGYTLTGERLTCVVQDVFAPDSRLLPQCVKVGEDELRGDGAHYQGPRNYSVTGKPCLSWAKELYQGSVFVELVDRESYNNGNHRYCRNTDGAKAVPYCLVMSGAPTVNSRGEVAVPQRKSAEIDHKTDVEFCFEHPGCDVCGEAVQNKFGSEYCDVVGREGKCNYRENNSEDQQDFFWDNCRRSCCVSSGCINNLT